MFGIFKKIKAAFPTAEEEGALTAWLSDNGFSHDGGGHSFYKDQTILHPDSTVAFVGFGTVNGQMRGFYLELSSSKVVSGRVIHRNAARDHQRIAADSMYSGTRFEYAMSNHSAEMITKYGS